MVNSKIVDPRIVNLKMVNPKIANLRIVNPKKKYHKKMLIKRLLR